MSFNQLFHRDDPATEVFLELRFPKQENSSWFLRIFASFLLKTILNDPFEHE